MPTGSRGRAEFALRWQIDSQPRRHESFDLGRKEKHNTKKWVTVPRLGDHLAHPQKRSRADATGRARHTSFAWTPQQKMGDTPKRTLRPDIQTHSYGKGPTLLQGTGNQNPWLGGNRNPNPKDDDTSSTAGFLEGRECSLAPRSQPSTGKQTNKKTHQMSCSRSPCGTITHHRRHTRTRPQTQMIRTPVRVAPTNHQNTKKNKTRKTSRRGHGHGHGHGRGHGHGHGHGHGM